MEQFLSIELQAAQEDTLLKCKRCLSETRRTRGQYPGKAVQEPLVEKPKEQTLRTQLGP